MREDLTGKTFGTLLVLGPDDEDYITPSSGKRIPRWKVHCTACGRDKTMLQNVLKKAQSCGCLSCVKLRKEPTLRNCAICGTPFRVYPSSTEQCCSAKCGAALRTRNGNRQPRKWSIDEKIARRNDPRSQAHIRNIQPQAVQAALSIPAGQKGPQNRGSLVWVLIDPEGQYHIAVGLRDWGRKNKDLFYPPDVDEDHAAQMIACGFGAIASSMRGSKSRQSRPVYTYKGWRIARLPFPKKEGDDLYDNALEKITSEENEE